MADAQKKRCADIKVHSNATALTAPGQAHTGNKAQGSKAGEQLTCRVKSVPPSALVVSRPKKFDSISCHDRTHMRSLACSAFGEACHI